MQTSLIVCVIVFLVAIVLLERLHSIKILIRLALTLGLIYGYIMAITNGQSIILFSVLLSCALAFVNIFIKNGIHKYAFSELFSVLITSFVTSGVIFAICSSTKPNIYQDAIMSFNGVKNPEDAILGVFMLVTLGIFMDIISKIIFDLNEQKDKTVNTPWKEQFGQGIVLGQKFITEKINLVIFSVLGVALFSIGENINKGMNISEIITNSEIFTYCLIAVVTGIGLVLSVFVTAFMYACLNRKKTIYKTTSENKLDGKRSLKL